MINAIIFSLEGVFVSMDYDAPKKALAELGLKNWTTEFEELEIQFETGKLKELQFIQAIQKHLPEASIEEIRNAWNSIFPKIPIQLNRLEFLQMLNDKFPIRSFLVGNMDPMRIEKFQHSAGISFYRDFYQCFEKIYFSYEIGMRKPDPKIFSNIISVNGLSPKKTLYIDTDKTNIDLASELGLQVWHLQPEREDVVDLHQKDFLQNNHLGI